MRRDKLVYQLPIPQDASVNIDNGMLIVSGKKGSLSRMININRVDVELSGSNIILSSLKPTKREKRMMGTFYSHISNMIKGVTEGFTYKLKVSSGHFPMAVSVKGSNVEIKNFFGERKPRTAKILDNVHVVMEGEILKVTGIDIEKVSQTSANIEQATRITNRDKRVFMDRINIISKNES